MTLEPEPGSGPGSGAVTRGFLFADLRGYTAFVEAHGDAAGAELLDVYRRLVRETIAHHGGAEIRTEGDSFYVVFPSASGAVAGGLGIVTAAAAATAADPTRPIRVGVGVHAGEAVEAPEGYVGSAVNIAARVCAQAGPGEVLVSETVRSLIRTSGRLAFTARGRRQLKGIAEPIALFRVDPAGAAPVNAPPPGWRAQRAWLLLGGGGLLGVALVAFLLLRGGAPAASPTPGTSGSAVAASPSPEIVERIAYSAVRQYRPADPLSCDFYLESHLRIVAPNGGGSAAVLRPSDLGENEPAWSPDGTHLAFVGYDQALNASLYVVAADGSGPRNLVPALPPGVDGFASYIPKPVWTADGRSLVFTYGSSGVWAVGADGLNLRRLIAPLTAPQPTPDPKGGTPEAFPPSFGALAWLPDGRLAVEVTDQNKDLSIQTTLYAAGADGSGLAPLPGMPSGIGVTRPAWSPDGRLAFVGLGASANPDDHPIPDLYLLDPGASAPHKVAGGGGISGSASWSPDGTRLAFAAADLYTVKADGTDLQKVASEPGQAICWADWGRTMTQALPAPTPSPAPGATPAPMAFHRGLLEAGTYVTDVFVPHMQMQIGPGWEALGDYLDGLALGRPEFPLTEIDVGRVQVVFDSPCLTGRTRTVGPTAREFFDYIQQNPYLDAGDPRPIVVGGRTGLQIDVTVARTPTAKTCPDEPEHLLNRVWLFETGLSSFWFGDQHRVRITSIDVGNGPAVTFVYGGDPKYADDFIKLAQPIIDSLAFP